jgi:glycosyltransferase involved in cell wall biosynthesis
MKHRTRNRGVSVVIPSYNHARFVAAAIESALAQTLEPLEILVVDDSSSDATAEVLERCRLAHPERVRVFIRPHAGIGATYTFGLGEARGDMVAFLESDDLWAPTYLEETVAFLTRQADVDWVNSAREIIDERGQATGKIVRKPSVGQRFTTQSLLTCDLGYTPTPVARVRALRAAGPFDPTTYAVDCAISLRFSLRYEMGYIDRPLYLYRRHAQNASGDRLRDARALVSVLERFGAEHGREIGPLRPLFQRCLAKFEGRAGVLALEADPQSGGDEALRRLRTALRIHPTGFKNMRRWLAAEILGPKYYAKMRRRGT